KDLESGKLKISEDDKEDILFTILTLYEDQRQIPEWLREHVIENQEMYSKMHLYRKSEAYSIKDEYTKKDMTGNMLEDSQDYDNPIKCLLKIALENPYVSQHLTPAKKDEENKDKGEKKKKGTELPKKLITSKQPTGFFGIFPSAKIESTTKTELKEKKS